MDWLCEKQVPVGGEPRLPQTMGGGGAIYPELESVINGMVTYYAPTVNHTLLECIKKEFFKINDTLLQWYPSRQTEEPMFLVLSAGSGGGWAVNSFFPKDMNWRIHWQARSTRKDKRLVMYLLEIREKHMPVGFREK